MNRIVTAVLAAILALPAMAADDFNSGNLPDTHSLSWGAGSPVLIYGSGLSNWFRIQTNSADRFAITSAGLVGVGTNVPLSKMDVSGSLAVGSYAASVAAPSNGLIVSGQVGVGTSVPAAASALEVGSTSAVRITKVGWLEAHQNQIPIASSCGNSASVASGTDMAGDVTVGTSATSCTITFAEAPTNIPHCFCSNRITKVPCIAQATASTVVLAGTGSTLTGNDILDWVCIGHQ